jgi:hypothetical protein
VNSFDVRITTKVLLVKRQNPFDPVCAHHSYEPRIVNLSARNIVRDEQFPPLSVNEQAVGQEF